MKQFIIILAILGGLSIPEKATIAAEPVFSKKYEDALAQEDSNVLVIFGTEWCGYCNKLKRDINSLGFDDYTVCVVDADTRKDLRDKYGVKSYPTSIIVRNNKEVSRISGYDKEDYEKWLESNRKESKPKPPIVKREPDQSPVEREKTMWEWLFRGGAKVKRRTAILCVVFAAIVLSRGCSVEGPIFTLTHSFQTKLLGLHNKERNFKGKATLRMNSDLNTYAQKHAEMMAKNDSLNHSSMSALSKAAGTTTVAENIAWGQETEESVVNSWMWSPGHRWNVLGNYTDVGFGMAKDKEGRPYWCTVFAKKEKNG